LCLNDTTGGLPWREMEPVQGNFKYKARVLLGDETSFSEMDSGLSHLSMCLFAVVPYCEWRVALCAQNAARENLKIIN